MTVRHDGTSLYAARLCAALLVSTLAVAWAGEARAGCGGLARAAADAERTALSLSAEVLGDASASPMEPSGCSGAFCGKTDGFDDMDLAGGVQLRVDSWACVLLLISLDHDRGIRWISRSDAPRPRMGRNELLDPPR